MIGYNEKTKQMNIEGYLQHKGMTEKTISRHQREIKRYKAWLSSQTGKTPHSATKKDLLDYLLYIKQSRKLSNATQNQILQTLKNYYAFLAKHYGVNNITHLIKIRGAERKHLMLPLTPDELDLICDAYYYHIQDYKPTAKELRFYPDQKTLLLGRYIALTLMAYQALRTSEILNLSATDFDLRKATLTVPQSRRAAARTLPLEAAQMGALLEYFTNEATLIPNLNHFEKLNESLKKLFPKYTDFRQIRASKITHWLKLHGLRKAQHLAGHKHIQSTERYQAGDFEALQNDLNTFHPLG